MILPHDAMLKQYMSYAMIRCLSLYYTVLGYTSIRIMTKSGKQRFIQYSHLQRVTGHQIHAGIGKIIRCISETVQSLYALCERRIGSPKSYVLYRTVTLLMTLSDPNHLNSSQFSRNSCLRSYLWNG